MESTGQAEEREDKEQQPTVNREGMIEAVNNIVSLKFRKYRFGRDCGISPVKQLRKIERRPEEHAHKKTLNVSDMLLNNFAEQTWW